MKVNQINRKVMGNQKIKKAIIIIIMIMIMILFHSEDKLNESNNKEYSKLSLGANFEYNALHFLLYGVNELINLPRIIYYPIVNFTDY